MHFVQVPWGQQRGFYFIAAMGAGTQRIVFKGNSVSTLREVSLGVR
jgi:hypothetical protein